MRSTRPIPPGTFLEPSELVLGPDGSAYHLALLPDPGGRSGAGGRDPGRIKLISDQFEHVELRTANREFIAHTGTYHGTRITALSTGIGTDNIDIVLNELDALVNVDLVRRTPKETHRSLRIVRLGTCGSLQPDIPVDARIVSTHGLGLDNVLHYYAHAHDADESALLQAFEAHTMWPEALPHPYVAKGDQGLVALLAEGNHAGITATAGGFYGPQGRQVRLGTTVDGLNDRFTSFRHAGLRIANYEMETSALYGLSALLGHRAATVCTVVANRFLKKFSEDHHAAVKRMVGEVLERTTA
ncbi:MAG: nucleoside phosphorylase [Flavobacteriales bacterium]|nr:nucleoside phosphorylase [Flavobacteriales bacterium]